MNLLRCFETLKPVHFPDVSKLIHFGGVLWKVGRLNAHCVEKQNIFSLPRPRLARRGLENINYWWYIGIVPAKNSRKQYVENGYYHLYNRGVEKRIIFLDEQDYVVFLSYLKQYLLPKDEKSLSERLADENISPKEKDNILKLLRLNNFADEMVLLAYCLMPNHFHFFVKQKSAGSIDKFMNSLGTRYTMYFNRKYKRVGSLYQGVYKAVQVVREEQFIYLTKYIHKQILALQGEALRSYSSYEDYLGKRKSEWVKPDEVLSYFSKTNPALTYKSFVEEINDINNIEQIILDEK